MIYVNVPLIRQEKNMSCWHASARMIWAFKNYQCIHPMPSTFDTNTGLNAKDFIRLAKELGFKSVPAINMTYLWRGLAELLRRHGPIWAAGYWYGAPHIIVITGVDPSGTVYVNDPGHHGRTTGTMEWFNKKIAHDVSHPLMFLPGAGANSEGYQSVLWS